MYMILEFVAGIAQVALGLGAVIFVHELGHFLVAKACGVQCDKFFIGFDIGGYKISRKWGETEYGIGILPLGGYVKMLGQDDNPAKAAEEMRRAKLYQEQQAAGEQGSEETPPASPVENTESVDAPNDGEQEYVFNPRSYLAKSVPQRMAIISAGVVMNIIFAFIFATIAYQMGVRYIPCVVNQTMPGSPAWTAGLAAGDEIVEIAGIKKPRFRHDLKPNVMLGDKNVGVELEVERPGDKKPFKLEIKPEDTRGQLTIGITSATSLDLAGVVNGSPAAEAKLEEGDKVIAVNDQPITMLSELTQILAANLDKSIRITVKRGGKKANSAATEEKDGKEISKEIGPQRLKRLGFQMNIGKIVGVQAHSPAADAGLKEGDFIALIDGEPVGDPVTLPQRLQRKAEAGEKVELEIQRDGEHQTQTLQITVAPRIPNTIESHTMGPMSAPALGIAYRVQTIFQSVIPGSPAEKAGIQGGEILSVRMIPDEKDESEIAQAMRDADPIEFGTKDNQISWPAFFSNMQGGFAADTKVALKIKRGQEEKEYQLLPVDSTEFNVPERGFRFQTLYYTRTADSFGEAAALGLRDTKEAMLMVYRFLQRLLDGGVSPRLLGGPVTIAKAAWFSTQEGPGNLFIFLTLLSANLAVVNFLPIPVLDGGHMVFLIYEGIFRRPASEKVIVAMQTIGFVFILSLMLFVLALDFGVISRG